MPRLAPLFRLVPVIAFAVFVNGCSANEEGVSTFNRDVRVLRQSADVALPVKLPPSLTEAWVTNADGVPLVNFYSENEPVVTICTSPVSRCAQLMPGSDMRTVQVDGKAVVIALGRSDKPDDPAQPRMGRQLGQFWADVALTTEVPKWLAQDNADGPGTRASSQQADAVEPADRLFESPRR